MASTNKTANYNLSQFEGTDKPSWEADYNADMLSIDTNLKAVSDVADGASGSVSTLADRVTTAEGNISTNANDIDALEARADALESGETIADGRLDALEAEQIVQNTAIESNTRLGYNLARPYDSASTYSVGAYVLFQDTLYKCTTAISTGESFDPSKWLAIKATDEIAAGGYTLPTASASTLGGVKVGNNLSIDNNGVLSGTIPIASANDLGGVKVGSGLSIDGGGVLSAGGATITTLDNTNFVLSVTSSRAYLVSSAGAGSERTLTNLVFDLPSPNTYESFIAEIGNLKIIQALLYPRFDDISVPVGAILTVDITTTIPIIMGSPINKTIVKGFTGYDDGIHTQTGYITLSQNNIIFHFCYTPTNTSSSTNVHGIEIPILMSYVTT